MSSFDDLFATLPNDPRRRVSPATARNREAILEVLKRVFPDRGTVIETASGSGEHAVYFASALSGLLWQPSDVAEESLSSIAAWTQATELCNVLAPILLDLSSSPPPGHGQYAAGFCANLIHIAPWPVCVNLMRFMGSHLARGAPLVLYGPYKVNGEHTSESNAKFEHWLWAQSPEYGVRDRELVCATADQVGLSLGETVTMPANNFCLVFHKRSTT